MTGDDIREAIAAWTPLTNPRLSEIDWDGVAGKMDGDGEAAELRATVDRLKQALRVTTHHPHDQRGEPVEGFPVCSVCGAIQTEPDSLGAAWQQAEAAIEAADAGVLWSVERSAGKWVAKALDFFATREAGALYQAEGPTPAAALLALAARLANPKGEAAEAPERP